METETIPSKADNEPIDGVSIIEPYHLYNLLNQICLQKPCVAITNYLLLLDVRSHAEYSESHIITAKHSTKDGSSFVIPADSDIETKKHIVIYDNRTQGFDTKGTSLGLQCAEYLWRKGSKNVVQVVKGGYEDFSARYPFLRTQKLMWTPKELNSVRTYPLEVIPGYLYIGTVKHAQDPTIHKHLKVKAHLNVTKSTDLRFPECNQIVGKDQESYSALFNVPVDDDYNEKEMGQNFFESASNYLANHHKQDGKSILVVSEKGTSRAAAIVLAFLIQYQKLSLKDAWTWLKSCNSSICPNTSFFEQLSDWEGKVHGSKVTDISDIYTWN